MSIGDYIIPHNHVALWIWYVIIILGIGWMWVYWWAFWKTQQFRDQLDRAGDGALVEALSIANRAKKGKEYKAELEDASTNNERGNVSFQKFCKDSAIPYDGIIAEHIRTMHESGLRSYQLDMGSLLEHTVQRITSINFSLRWILATFVVLGLLGTLFGLADTIAAFRFDYFDAANNSQLVRDNLYTMFINLRSAFAPSIAGVSFSVVFSIAYVVFVAKISIPAVERIVALTQQCWFPRLCPTPVQQFSRTLLDRAVSIQESAITLSQAGNEIYERTEYLKKELASSASALSQFASTADKLTTFSSTFETAANRLVQFQNDLKSLYNEMVNSSQTIQRAVIASIDENKKYQAESIAQVLLQQERIERISKSLMTFEENYGESVLTVRKQMEQFYKEVLDSQKETRFDYQQALSVQNKNWQDAYDKATMGVTEKLGQVVNHLAGLAVASDRSASRMDASLVAINDRVAGMREDSVKMMDATSEALRRSSQTLADTAESMQKKFLERFDSLQESMKDGYKSSWLERIMAKFRIRK